MDQFTDVSLTYSMWQGPQSGLLFNSGGFIFECCQHDFGFFLSLKHHRMQNPPVVDWPYPMKYVNVSIEEMAPTHRLQYLMVRKPNKIFSGGHQKIFSRVLKIYYFQGYQYFAKLTFFPVLLAWAITIVASLVVGHLEPFSYLFPEIVALMIHIHICVYTERYTSIFVFIQRGENLQEGESWL